MKKLAALLLALMLLPTAALADLEVIPGTSLMLDPDPMLAYDLTDEDYDESLMLAYALEDETLECAIYLEEIGDYTLADLEETFLEQEGLEAAGYTTINGVETYYLVFTDDDGSYVVYYAVDNGLLAEILFWFADLDAAQISGVIMSTLCR